MLFVYTMHSFVTIPPHTPLGIGEICRNFTIVIATRSAQPGTCKSCCFLFVCVCVGGGGGGGQGGEGFSQQNDAVINPLRGGLQQCHVCNNRYDPQCRR